jgi:FtsH-binding integral membrane protein
MNTPTYGYRRDYTRPDVLFDEGLRQHMLRVYNYMGLGLVVTGVAAYAVASTPALYEPIFSTPLKWVVMLAPLAFVMLFSFRIQSMSASGAQAMFWAFCAVMGLSLASVFLSLPKRASHAPSSSQPRCSARPVSTAIRPGATLRSSRPSWSWA